ncbi:MAG: hypothetical protein HXX08_01655 [Chloroflexi bacterium]|uniref:Cardiolipin synthase N-terminal domain-containing protein n=1 Tax=Candidatus Chlorohelix allophototropha TaxID=3003348 RepID=A0A8T7LWI1_9CHLR|nr:hypothetical protein [Chloroflexota bacterium]WJW66453.1 hypothetical protein OZ401_002251 [Chloroflexota bacterium L227-S17]
MNWEQVLKNIGAMTGLLALTLAWLIQALWMRVEADKRGMQGWLWAFIGIITPPVGLFVFLFWRVRYPVRAEVAERDAVFKEMAERKVTYYQILQEKDLAESEKPLTPEEQQASIAAALEAESRPFRNEY